MSSSETPSTGGEMLEDSGREVTAELIDSTKVVISEDSVETAIILNGLCWCISQFYDSYSSIGGLYRVEIRFWRISR